MYKIIQPPKIIFGINSAKNYSYPTKCLVITSQGTKNRDWLNYLGLEKYDIFDMVEPNPSMETVDKILTKFDFELFSTIIGLGGGSSLDVAKYVAFKTNKKKIMIPTTFGSGRDVGKKYNYFND